MAKPPAFQFYAAAWAMGTAHLSLEAQGAYARLLCHQWLDGPLPDDPATLRRLLGVSAGAFARLWPSLEPHFPPHGEAYRANPRLERERVKQEEYRQRQGEHGRRGGRPAKPNRSVQSPFGDKGLTKGSHSTEAKGSPKGTESSLSLSSSSVKAEATTKEQDLLPKTTWLTPYENLWREHFSAALPFGQAAKVLKPLEAEHGSLAVLRALGNYLAAHAGERSAFVSLPKFAATFGQWLNPTRPKSRQDRNFEAIDLGLPDEEEAL